MHQGVRDLPRSFEDVLEKAEAEKRRLARLLPDMDPGDLHAILVAMLRPWGMGRRIFLRELKPGVHVF